MKKKNLIPVIMLGISLIGFGFFYFVPFLLSFSYALIDNPIHNQFVGMKNFQELFQNNYFLLGLKNTGYFMVISIPLNLVLSLLIALALYKESEAKGQKYITLIFLIPLVIPSATTAFFWEKLFSEYGIVNKLLNGWGIENINWFQSKYAMTIMIFIFLWKNIGYNMVLFLSGLHNIPIDYYECALLEGATKMQTFKKITLVYLQPTFFLAFIMTFVNSFKIFKEIYIITGEFPHESVYVLQHYMNNMFLSLNYPKLVSASYIVTIAIVILVTVVFRGERRISKNLTG